MLEKHPKFLSVGKISFRVRVGITTVLEKQPIFWSVGKISFLVHVGITMVLEKQPKFECWKNIIPSSCRNFLECHCENRIGNSY